MAPAFAGGRYGTGALGLSGVDYGTYICSESRAHPDALFRLVSEKKVSETLLSGSTFLQSILTKKGRWQKQPFKCLFGRPRNLCFPFPVSST